MAGGTPTNVIERGPGTVTHHPDDGYQTAVWILLDILDVAEGHEGVDPELAAAHYRLARDYAALINRSVEPGTADSGGATTDE